MEQTGPNLMELYSTIMSKGDIPYDTMGKRRIAIVMPTGELDVMKIHAVGEGRPRREYKMSYMAVAKICPGQSSMILGSDGSVRLTDLMEVRPPGDVYDTYTGTGEEMGALRGKHRAYWVDLDENTSIKPLTKAEMRTIESALQ